MNMWSAYVLVAAMIVRISMAGMSSDCNCWEHVYLRTACSYGGYLDEFTCNAVNCCYDDSTYEMQLRPRPLCYEKRGTCPADEQCLVPGLHRDVCGHRALDRNPCEFRGCCFDQSQYPMCYRPKPLPTTTTTTTQTTVQPITTTTTRRIISTTAGTNTFNGGPFGFFQIGSIVFYSQCPSKNGTECGTNITARSFCNINHCCWNANNTGTSMSPCYRPNVFVIRWPTAAQWSAWSLWSLCNNGNCGSGLHSRNRTCVLTTSGDVTGCVGNGIELANCSNPCPPTWGAWSQWGACSNNCGLGVMKRTRDCVQKDTVVDSIRCPGRRFSVYDTASCNIDLCSTWSNWVDGDCTVTCGLGIMARSRTCTSEGNRGNLLSASCSESFTACQLLPCPIDPTPISIVGVWGPWSLWSKCSEDCGSGLRNRFRQCYNTVTGALLRAEDGHCTGGIFASTETEFCNGGYCSAWSTWSAVSTCTVPCGGGTRRESRTCLMSPTEPAPEVCSMRSISCQEDPCTFR
nr:A disintegrin and metalloproteinase with thrombospondin motifs adt-2-like [Ciona intestinalis]|eukprot:XP_018673082.2 A disintegrin and metalloproteinase with thrombospondin motifs adt-2-like [Ciona intestinalis]